ALVGLVAEPALEWPVVRLDRVDEVPSPVAVADPDQPAAPAPGRVVAAVPAAVDADDLFERPGGEQRGLAAAGAPEHDVVVADLDHVVDPVRAGGHQHDTAAGSADVGDRLVDRGRGV